MTLILKFDLDMVKMYQHTKNEVSMSRGSKVIAWTDRNTDRHTHRHTDRHDQKHYLTTYAGGNNKGTHENETWPQKRHKLLINKSLLSITKRKFVKNNFAVLQSGQYVQQWSPIYDYDGKFNAYLMVRNVLSSWIVNWANGCSIIILIFLVHILAEFRRKKSEPFCSFILVFAKPSIGYHRSEEGSEVTEHVECVVDGGGGGVIVQ